MNIRKD